MADDRMNATDPLPGAPSRAARAGDIEFPSGDARPSDAGSARAGLVYCSGDSRLWVDAEAKSVLLDGRQVCLTKRELELLCALASRSGSISSRAELSAALYGPGTKVRSRSIDTYVKNLRAKLGDDSTHPRWIETIHGVGYRFIGRVG